MMRLPIKIRYSVIIVLVYFSLHCLFKGEVLGGQDSSGQEAISELRAIEPYSNDFFRLRPPGSESTTEVVSEKQEIAQEEPKPVEVITRRFEIKNIDVDEAKERMQSLLTKDKAVASSIKILTLEKAGKKIDYLEVKDTPQNMEQISLAIEQLEKEFAPILIDVDFTDVELSKILTMFARTTDLNIIGGEELSQKVSIHIKDVPLREVFDILLRASGYTYLREAEVLRIIPEEEMPLVTEVFELQYVSAPKIEQAASHLISSEGELKSFSKFQYNDYSQFLIVTDTKAAVERVRQLVKKLDKKVRQVMIEAKFVEVILDKDDELGIDWVLEASITGASSPTVFPVGQDAQRMVDRPLEVEESSGAITLGTISFSDFSATLHALGSKTETHLIASPSIATRDGEDAEIIIGDRVPIPLYERNEETGTIEVTGYEDEDVGVLLRVTPIINNDNTILLKVHPEVSEITGYTGPNDERPIVSTREVTTSFTVENGKTIVLGGLMKKTTINTVRKIPFLGDIPIIGKIFTYHDDADDRKELLIFITPHIVGESRSVSVAEMKKGFNIPQ